MKKLIVLCLTVFVAFSISCNRQPKREKDKALEELNKEYEAFKKEVGQGEVAFDFVDRYDSLSRRFEKAGDLHSSIECDKKMLEIFTQTWDEPVPRTAFRLWRIGYKYGQLKEYDSALTYLDKSIKMEKSLARTEESDDSIHERLIAGCYHDMALIYLDRGETQKAIESLEAADNYQPSRVDGEKEIAASYSDLLATLYKSNLKYEEAADYFEKALYLYQEACPDSVHTINNVRENLLSARYCQSVKDGQVGEFLSNHIFVITCNEGDTPARKQGMTGEYILLEYAGWNLNSKESLYDVDSDTMNKTIDVVVMRDNSVEKHRFEGEIGIEFHVREIDKNERNLINNKYKNWKSKNIIL